MFFWLDTSSSATTESLLDNLQDNSTCKSTSYFHSQAYYFVFLLTKSLEIKTSQNQVYVK